MKKSVSLIYNHVTIDGHKISQIYAYSKLFFQEQVLGYIYPT